VTTKERYQQRRELGVCIYGEAHGRAVHGGRCAACWKRKLAGERAKFATNAAYRIRKRAALELLYDRANADPAARRAYLEQKRYRRKCREAGVPA
jgi:hypothetical protein